MQLGQLLAEGGDHATANALYKEAAAGGSVDAVYHLGVSYMRGTGVPRSLRKGVALLAQADKTSKYMRLRGGEALLVGVVRFVYESRVALLLGAALLSVLARGGNPVEMLGGLLGGGSSVEAPAYEGSDEFDDFDEE